MAFDDFLRQTATISELQSQKDVQGGVYQSWIPTLTVKCLVQPRSGGVDREDAKDGSAATHNILIQGSHNLTARNQIQVGTYVYNVVRCNDWNSLSHHTTAECVVETS